MNRKYISFLLRNSGKKLYRGKTIIVADLKSSLLYKRGRKKVYTKDVIRPLVEIWKLSGVKYPFFDDIILRTLKNMI